VLIETAVGGLTFLIVAWALRMEELNLLFNMVRRRQPLDVEEAIATG